MKPSRIGWASVFTATAFLAASCSGIVPGLGQGAVVSPDHLARYSRGGSMSTLWYHGSDAQFHYFSHFCKVSTRYRIRRLDMHWPGEFPLDGRQAVLASPYFSRHYYVHD